jgi:hexosaminidase
MLMGGAGLKWIVMAATVALMVDGVAQAAPAAPPRGAPIAVPAVIPLPAHVESRPGVFVIRAGTRISIPRDPRAARAARYFADLMQKTRGIKLAVDVPGARPAAHSIVFRLDARAAGSSKTSSTGESNPEAYAVDISPDRIVLSASDPRGLLYAGVTLWQLCTSSASQGDSAAVPSMKITDSPRFAWRGLMLDSARQYQSPEFIVQLIDWMALHKLNVLHWHLTDDQAWRLEIKRYPRLTSVGAWRVPAGAAAAADIDPATGQPRLYGGFYSQETVRHIVAHASERNVTIVPEIGMPGHATAAIVAYPRLASVVPAPATVTSNWGVYSNLYNVDESTFEFLQNVLAEVIQLFPGEYVHVGGDEALKDQWKASPHIQARMRELGVPNEDALQSYFVGRVSKFLSAHRRRLIGWDEILEGGITPDATVMSWRGIDGALAAAAAGHDSVLSPAPTLYLDNRQSTADTQPGRASVITLQDVYQFNPMPASLPLGQRHHILGVQANIWTEHIRTEERVEYMTFPRAAALAEVGWSAPERLGWDGFLARLPDQMNRYKMLGIHAYSDQIAAASAPAGGSLADRSVASGGAPHLKRSSHELRSCTNEIALSLEDDAPLSGERATFLVDIMNPCWIYPAADLSRVTGIDAAVGQLPFEFQLGADVHVPKLNPPQTPAGELEVRIDGCDGERIAVLPLQPAVVNNAVTELPATKIAHREGTHDLCMKFTQRSHDPMWVLDWVRLLE